jgi:hypothetical protein
MNRQRHDPGWRKAQQRTSNPRGSRAKQRARTVTPEPPPEPDAEPPHRPGPLHGDDLGRMIARAYRREP